MSGEGILSPDAVGAYSATAGIAAPTTADG
jgi:hypothetical protein